MPKVPNGWTKKDDKLILQIKLPDFKRAVAMLNYVSDIAEQLNHHPNMAIKNYNELSVVTTTHEDNRLTDKDYELAQMITDLIEYQSNKEQEELDGRS
jgi:4a-hydroxytetrahydrobiopterin dehydratase